MCVCVCVCVCVWETSGNVEGGVGIEVHAWMEVR